MALFEICTPIVAELRHQQHILEQLVLKLLGEAATCKDILECILWKLKSNTALPILCLNCLEIRENLFGCIVFCGPKDSSSEDFLPSQQNPFDEFASVIIGVEQWDGGSRGDRQGNIVSALEVIQALSGDIRHVESGEEERRRQANGSHVVLDLCLGIEVGDFGKLSAGDYTARLDE